MAGATAVQKNEWSGDEVAEARPAPKSVEFRQHIGDVSRHSSVYFAGRIFAVTAGYFFKVYLTRELGAEALGTYALGLTLIGALGIFDSFGISRSATRFVSAYQATGQFELLRGFLFRSIFVLVLSNLLFLPLLMVLGPVVAQHIYHAPALNHLLWLFAALMFLSTFNVFFARVLAGYKQVARNTILTTFLGMPTMMLCTIAFVAAGWGLRGYLIAQVSADAVVLICLAITVWKLTPRSARLFSRPLPKFEKRVVSFSLVALAMEILGFIILHADKIFLGFYLTPRQVGIYAVAFGITSFVPIILQSVNQIFSPIISDLHSRHEYRLMERMFQTITKWTFGLTFPLAAALIIFARPWMAIFGRDFEAGWAVLVIGTLGQLVNCVVGSSGSLLLMSGNEKHLLKMHVFTAIVCVGLDLALIRSFGMLGAATAAAIANVMINLWYLKGAYDRLHILPYNKSYWRLVPAFSFTIVSLLAVNHFAAGAPKWVVLILGGAAAYASFLGAAFIAGLDADDRLITEAIWSRMKRIFLRAEASASA
jgi:O-antigen/teichoic acid export membrane protein